MSVYRCKPIPVYQTRIRSNNKYYSSIHKLWIQYTDEYHENYEKKSWSGKEKSKHVFWINNFLFLSLESLEFSWPVYILTISPTLYHLLLDIKNINKFFPKCRWIWSEIQKALNTYWHIVVVSSIQNFIFLFLLYHVQHIK